MAELIGAVLGSVIGSIGNITGRVRHGKNYLSRKPPSFIPGTSPAAVARRKKFKLAVIFSHAVIILQDLKTVWKKVTDNGLSVFNHITQVNYKLFENTLPSASNVITPPDGFNFSASGIVVSRSGVIVPLDAFGSSAGFDTNTEKFIKLYAVVFLSNPNVEGLEENIFISAESVKTAFQTTDPISLTVAFDPNQSAVFQKYDSSRAYFAVATLDENDKPVRYSITHNQ